MENMSWKTIYYIVKFSRVQTLTLSQELETKRVTITGARDKEKHSQEFETKRTLSQELETKKDTITRARNKERNYQRSSRQKYTL